MEIEESIQRIESLLAIIQSSAEKKTLQQKLYNLKLISILIDDIKKAEKLLKNEYFKCYLKDLKRLQTIFSSSEKNYLKNIQWFLDSDLFSLMLFAPEYFRVNLEEIYQKLLYNVKFNKKEEIFEHKEILIEKANFYIQDTDIGAFGLRELFLVLEKKIHEFRSAHSNPNVPSSSALESTNNLKA